MKKDILIIGGGGREHAIAYKLRLSKDVGKVYAMPGNGGISRMENCECVPVKPLETDKIIEFLRKHDIYLTVVSTDDALAAGTVDTLNKNGFRAFGPSKAAAEIEWSKSYSKAFMKRNNIPSAKFEVFDSQTAAFAYIDAMKIPIVVKADGLALGKGVVICETKAEAKDTVKEMLGGKFGLAGQKVLIEEYVRGFEATILAFTDGETVKPMVSSRDYKRAFDGDKGLNTGGMGTVSPCERFEPYLKRAYDEVFEPTIRALKREGRLFKGVIYYDIMVDEPFNSDAVFNIIEYNARFGDPEAQVVLPRLKTDLLTVFDAVIEGRLKDLDLEWDNQPRVCVVAASKGYPEAYETGKKITFNNVGSDTLVFHAGTKPDNGELRTSGGRVLGVVGKGATVKEAAQNAYKEMEKISFDGMFFRKDIGIQ